MLRGLNVLYVTLEMSEEMIAHRIMANTLKTELDTLKTFSKDQLVDKLKRASRLVSDRIHIKEYPTGSTSTNTIRGLCKELEKKKQFVPDLIVTDYLGIMKTNATKTQNKKYEDLKTVAEELRDLASELDIPILSAMQTGRDGHDATDLRLTDISESFGVAMTADVTIAGIRTPELDAMKQITFKVVKNRFGAIDKLVNAGFDFAKMTMTDIGDTPRDNYETGSDNTAPVETIETPSIGSISQMTADDSPVKRTTKSLSVDFE
jgi:replicative DNA helicase